MTTTVIARFPTYKALAFSVGCFTLIAFFFLETLYLPPGGLNEFLRSHGGGWLFFLVIGWAAAIVCLMMLFALLRQIVFARSCAVWSDEKHIFYLSRHFMTVPKDALASVSMGTFGRFNSPAIILSLRDGRTKIIPTGGLSEDAKVILIRLQKAILGSHSDWSPSRGKHP
jgi:hypothetical protein